MSRVFAYLRVSTEHQVSGDQNGLKAQTDAIFNYCAANQIPPQGVLFCRDEGISGGAPITSRPALRELLYELQAGDVVLVSSLCRLSRDLMNGLLIEEEIKRKNAKLVSVKGEGTESDAPEAILMRRMLQVFSSHERSQISARTKAALQSRKRRGLRTGTIPYGFQVAGNGKKLIPVDSEIEVLSTVERMRNMGSSFQSICDSLNAEGIKNRKGRDWSSQLLGYVFRGWMKDGKDRYLNLQNSSWV